jgi:hypothetical protein
MSVFTKFDVPLLIQFDSAASAALGADHWRVAREFRYMIGSEDSQQWVTVPAGYLTDGASVPRIFWSLLPPWGANGQAAVVHDLLCEYLQIMDHGRMVSITRERADQIFIEAMRVLEVQPSQIAMIAEGLAIYRRLPNVGPPSNTLAKRLLESRWP